MRVIHLGFQLHQPIFADKAAFGRANEEIYQPLLAFLERNTQKFRGFRFSLLISGPWLELAEQYDADLIVRLQKLVKLGQVELVVEPWAHSLAFFYDQDELTEQVRTYRTKIRKLFGVEGRIFALPELIYSDQIGKWAEDFGFAGMLAEGSPAALGWRNPNHVYEAMECRYLRLLFRNTVLSRAIAEADPELLTEKRVVEDSEEKKLVLSAQKFQKKLELEMLRGNLVNLYLDAAVFQTQRGKGIVGFFDDLVANWLEVPGNHFVGAAQACVVETPNLALSVKGAVSWRDEPAEIGQSANTGIMLQAEAELQPPRSLSSARQVEQSKALYGLRREILATEDEQIIEDWRRLTAVDYLDDLPAEMNFQAILTDLQARAETAKKAQAVEISRTYTKKRDRGEIDVRPVAEAESVVEAPTTETVVEVAEPESESKSESEFGPGSEDNVVVQSLSQLAEPQPVKPVDDDPNAVEIKFTRAADLPKPEPKPRGIRKVIRKLVIE